MSEENEEENTCASCGIAEIDDVKLIECDGCDLVRYCSDECQENHKSIHEAACKKRAAEIRDEILFKQPETTHLGDCPICSLPLYGTKTVGNTCCSKSICNGCVHANYIRFSGQYSCPFCRKPLAENDQEADERRMKRIAMNDPVATYDYGLKQFREGEYQSAFEHWTKAAELGYADAHYSLSLMYSDGDGVEKDEGKEKFHLEEAAIGGHPEARHNLGCMEWNNGIAATLQAFDATLQAFLSIDHENIYGNIERKAERAVKHWIIAATLGFDESIKSLMTEFRNGHVSKEVLAAALRAHHAAVDATKSEQREAAEEWSRMKKEAKNSTRRISEAILS